MTKDKMKIMYLLFSFTIGGMERLSADIANHMSADVDVYVCIINDLCDDDMLNALQPNVHVICLKRPTGKKFKLRLLWQLAKIIRKEKIDIIHCNGYNTPETLLLAKLLVPRIKIFYTVHAVGQYKNMGKVKVLLRNIMCNKLIAISDSVKKEMLVYGASPQKTVRIYNAIDLQRFKQTIDTKKTLTEKIVIGNVARIFPKQKGQDILIEAVALIKSKYSYIQCCFIGGTAHGEENQLKQLESLVKDKHLEENVKFCGLQSDIPFYLKRFDIFVLPSRCEGFGISLVEAMAAGVPCIASNLDGPAEIIGKNERGLLFTPNSSQSLANCLDKMICNYNVYKAKAEDAKKFVNDKFDIKNMCSMLMNLYLEA